MKIPKTFLLLAAAACAAFGALAPVQAHAQVSYSYFYDTLDQYGEWVETPDYGYVWHPTGVDENWAPYTDGYWAYTDAGWTWVSYEDYGGIVYHYGRWANLPDEGWVWVPGHTWAPAWVSWRYSDDYVGWAPLPPEARWREDHGFGFGGGVDVRFDIGPGFYSFVAIHDFGEPSLDHVIVNRDQNVTIINNTTNITNITTNNSHVYVGGPSYNQIAAHTARPIPTLKLVRQTDAAAVGGQGGKTLSHQQGNQLMVVAPNVTAPAAGSHIVPSKVAKTLTNVQPEHGWSIVKDPEQRQKLQGQFKAQAAKSGGLKPVNPADVSLVSEKTKSQPAAQPAATAKPGKGKTPSNEELLNAPAAEPGNTAPAATPKQGKGKNKKTPTPPTPTVAVVPPNAPEEGATPKPKNKKAKTPAPAPEEQKPSGSNLQPFMGGNPPGEKPEKKPQHTPEESQAQEAPRNIQPPSGGGQPQSSPQEKNKKKHKVEPTPPGN